MKVFGILVEYQSRHCKDVSSVTPPYRHSRGNCSRCPLKRRPVGLQGRSGQFIRGLKYLVVLAGTEVGYLSDPGLVTDMYQQFPKQVTYNEQYFSPSLC
jgi:hypothetical protein